MPLTRRQRRFVRELAACGNQAEAARRSGYSAKWAENQASNLMAIPEVRAAAEAELAAVSAKAKVSAIDVLVGLARIASADPIDLVDAKGMPVSLRDIPPDLRRCIASMEITQIGEKVFVSKLRFADRLQALKLLGEHLRIFQKDAPPPGATLESLILEAVARARGTTTEKTGSA